MAGNFILELDEGSLRSMRRVQKLIEEAGDGVKPAIARALNRAADGVRTDASQAVTGGYGVKAKEVGAAFRRNKHAAANSLTSEVRFKGSVLGLIRFGAKPNKPGTRPAGGVSVNVTSRNILNGSFIASMNSGHTGVFVRRSDRSIYELFGPSVPQMLDSLMEEDDDLIDRGFDERFETRLDHELGRLAIRSK